MPSMLVGVVGLRIEGLVLDSGPASVRVKLPHLEYPSQAVVTISANITALSSPASQACGPSHSSSFPDFCTTAPLPMTAMNFATVAIAVDAAREKGDATIRSGALRKEQATKYACATPFRRKRNCRVIQAGFAGVGSAFSMVNQPDLSHKPNIL